MKHFFFFILSFSTLLLSQAQVCGTETFSSANLTTTYANSSYTGDNSVTWTYVQSRDESTYGITGKGIMLRRVADNSKVTSSAVSGGIGAFTCSLKKAFTGAGNRQVELYVNNVLKGTSLAWDNTSVQTFTVTGINVSGPVVIEIRNITAYQVIVDDISWTCYAAPSGTPTIVSSLSAVSALNYNLGSGPSASQSFVLSASDLTANVSGTAVTNFEFSLDDVTFNPFPGSIVAFAGSVPSTTIYVRLIAGLTAGTYIDTLTLSSPGATSVQIIFSGQVIPPPPAIVLNEFLADPDAVLGDANGDGLLSTTNDEFVEFYNSEAFAVDMSGWTVSDALSVQHTFPAFTIVPAGGFITVFGGGTPTGISGVVMTAIPAGLSLNNTADNIVLKDNFGTIINTYTYGAEGGDNQSVGRDPDFTGSFVKHSTIVALGRLFSPGAVNVTPPSSCSITALTAAAPSACNPLNNQYSVDITVTYTSSPAAGTLDVNGQSFAITSSPQTVTLTALPSTGTAIDVTAVFSDDGTCTLTETALYTAPASCTPPIPDCSDLFFSEYIEGSSNNKCYEIYNPTAVAIDMAVGSYEIRNYNNGSSTPVTTALSGVVPAYGTFVVCNTGAAAAFTTNADVVGGPLASTTFYNGDDVLALYKGANLLDAIGQIGVDPGTNWSSGGIQTSEQTLIRISTVKAGDNEGTDAFDPSLQWLSLGVDVATNLGQHMNECAPFIWTGNTDTDWNTASNWNKNAVPTGTEQITIPSAPIGGYFPLASMDITVSDLTIDAGASLEIAPTFGLIIDGAVVNNGTITLQSSASGTAWLDDFTNLGASFTGDLIVQTYVTTGSGLGQRFFGSPVTSGAVQGLDGTYTGYPLGAIIPTSTCDPNALDPSSPYSNLFEWNEAATFPTSCEQEGWVAISAATNLTPGRAYSGWVNDASLISFAGTPNTGDVIYITSGVSGSGVANADGWHLLSNPFPSPLDVASVINSGFTSPMLYDGGSGPFSGTYLPALVTGNGLAVMQGFVAEATGGSSFTASQADRIAGNAVWMRPDFTHMLEITVQGDVFADKTFVYFDFDATNAFDNFGDSKKRDSDFGHPTLFTNLNGNQMSLNGYALDNMSNTVEMGLKPGIDGSFTLNFDGLESFPITSLIFIEDKLTGVWTNLRESSTYTFQASTSDLIERFNIHFTAPISIHATESSCEGADASLSIDFGSNIVNTEAIKWNGSFDIDNYALIPINEDDEVIINNLDAGLYSLNLNYGSYNVVIPITINGKERVSANFDLPSELNVSATIDLISNTTGASYFTWTINDEIIANSALASYSFTQEGINVVELNASNDDCASVLTKEVFVSSKTTAIKNADDFEAIRVYASNGKIIVDLTQTSLTGTSHVELYNLLGQIFYKNDVQGTGKVQIDIKTESVYYFVKVSRGNSQKTFKVFIK